MGYPMAMGYPPMGYPGGSYPASYYSSSSRQENNYSAQGSFFRGTDVPEFKLKWLSIVNMNTNNTGAFSGDWDSRISVINPNKINMYFNNFHVQIYYKEAPMGSSLGSGFELGERESRELNLKASSTPTNPIYMDKWRMEEMEKERGSGSVTFSLHVGTITTYRTGYMSSRTWQMEARCQDVKLLFKNGANSGAYDNGDKPIDCRLF
ncbi:NDR1/HIN1-like protein 6 [Senna tora]|uniref:NDR1/HIN1-like protein 6 n=1 Tax=Senna tora TaxID=362788 RepID=A0A834W065_9FABA|nr:NDR1/HIN1-like protein 6 [Senna tora]